MVIGDAQIDLKETELLKLPPGTAVNPKLSHHDFDCASEILNVKLRHEQRTWEEHDSDVRAGIEAYKWMELEEQEKIKKAEEEANLRQIFDPMHGILNFSKKRVTDSSHNTFVKLPKELSADLETFINLRRQRYKSIFNVQFDITQNGVQWSNLSRDQAEGLKTLEKRTKEEDIFILKTDKSGKLVARSPEAYLEMGEEHCSRDKEITMEQVRQLSSAPTSSWIKMFHVGAAQGS